MPNFGLCDKGHDRSLGRIHPSLFLFHSPPLPSSYSKKSRAFAADSLLSFSVPSLTLELQQVIMSLVENNSSSPIHNDLKNHTIPCWLHSNLAISSPRVHIIAGIRFEFRIQEIFGFLGGFGFWGKFRNLDP
jgi:hypothetical protein